MDSNEPKSLFLVEKAKVKPLLKRRQLGQTQFGMGSTKHQAQVPRGKCHRGGANLPWAQLIIEPKLQGDLHLGRPNMACAQLIVEPKFQRDLPLDRPNLAWTRPRTESKYQNDLSWGEHILAWLRPNSVPKCHGRPLTCTSQQGFIFIFRDAQRTRRNHNIFSVDKPSWKLMSGTFVSH